MGCVGVPLARAMHEPGFIVADAVLMVTDHAASDWTLVAASAPVIVDARDAMVRRGSQGRPFKA
jgi:hypothetical protein